MPIFIYANVVVCWCRFGSPETERECVCVCVLAVYLCICLQEGSTECAKMQPTNPYAASKAAAEFIVSSYWECFKVSIQVLCAVGKIL